jgi:beta-mannosidase
MNKIHNAKSFMKHTFKLLSLALIVSTTISVVAGSFSNASALTSLDLGGEWQVSASGSNDWFAATVPGCIHTDLLAAKRIPDPFYRDNEKRVQWISELGWTYRRTFQTGDELLKHEHLLLHCEGLDTLATVLVNGVKLGRTDNMYRLWEFDVKKLLQPGTNSIEIRFDPVLPVIRAKETEQHLPTWQYPGAAYVRKMPCNFGWDWGPTLITCGIWRNISLVAFDTARLDDVQILQDHSQFGQVKLIVQVSTDEKTQVGLYARINVTTADGKIQKPIAAELAGGNASAELVIAHPKLWWPAGMGAQPLYTVRVELCDAEGKLLDATQKRVGLRTIKIMEQTDSEPMHFMVNGMPFFAKGANWIPADAFPTRSTKAQLRRYMADSVVCNMNTLRFWGGGYYEDDELFDACDELGICVWMDFKFACSTYPANDTNFLANVRQEAVEQVKRLRHHPSIGVWCGNNEIMFFRGGDTWQWIPKEKIGQNESNLGKMSAPDYNRLFKDTLGGVMQSLAPQVAYVTGSPDCGDVHYWEVWHGGKPFEAYRAIHGFISEFGFQSFPVPATVNAFTAPEDRTNVYSPAVKYHERSNRASVESPDDGQIGTDKIMKMVRMNFREPKDFESTLWLSQINQAFGIEFAAERWRREMPKSMGCVYWQYNDTWPGTSWSSVDYFGRWKALQFRTRHFYAPVLVSGDFNATNGTVSLWLTSDELKPVQGKLNWRVTDFVGNKLCTGKLNVTQAAQKSSVVGSIDLGKLVQSQGAKSLLVWLKFDGGGKLTSDNVVLLARPKELQLHDPQLSFTASGSGTNYTVTVRSEKPALWVWLDIPGVDARFSDNFVHVAPGVPTKFNVQLTKPMSKCELLETLQAKSLFSTYNQNLENTLQLK